MTADYPGATWVPADPTNYREAFRESYALVIIHCTDGHEHARPVAEMWQKPGHGSSAHFVVGRDGAVIQTVLLKDVAWHAHDRNAVSVGVEHCARTPGELGPHDPGLPPSDALYQSSARLVAWLLARAGLGIDAVKGHAQADPKTSHIFCPEGCGWDWPRYLTMVQQAMDVVA